METTILSRVRTPKVGKVLEEKMETTILGRV